MINNVSNFARRHQGKPVSPLHGKVRFSRFKFPVTRFRGPTSVDGSRRLTTHRRFHLLVFFDFSPPRYRRPPITDRDANRGEACPSRSVPAARRYLPAEKGETRGREGRYRVLSGSICTRDLRAPAKPEIAIAQRPFVVYLFPSCTGCKEN